MADPEGAERNSAVGASSAAERIDALIAGDGFVALAASLALRKALGAQARILIAAEPSRRAARDGRAFAIAPSSRRLLCDLGVWEKLDDEAQPILDITVTDSRLDDTVRPSLLSFASDPREERALAHMVEAEALLAALDAKAQSEGIGRIAHRVTAVTAEASHAGIACGPTRKLAASLVVAADGGRSICRDLARIGWISWKYDQLGLTAVVSHEREHHGRAYEHFLPGGPFAILPLKGRRSSIVWAENPREAKRLLALTESELVGEVARRFGHALGRLGMGSPLFSYPLGFGVARAFTAQRLALIGDAAHLVHPVAGQGLNLGFRDVAALAEAVGEAARLGLDPGSAHVLASYQRMRRFDTTAMGATTDGLVKLFSNNSAPLRALRDLGLGIVDRLPFAKRFLLREAAGGVEHSNP